MIERHSADWYAGAEAEARARREGRSKGGLDVLGLVDAMARQGQDRDSIVESVAVIYSAGWSLRDRFRLAWRILR